MATNLQNYQSGIIQRGLYQNDEKSAVISAIENTVLLPSKVIYNAGKSIGTSSVAVYNAGKEVGKSARSIIDWIEGNWQLCIVLIVAIVILLK